VAEKFMQAAECDNVKVVHTSTTIAPRSLHMTTTAKATAAKSILAIDLGKHKSVACIYHSAMPDKTPSAEKTSP
jgi:hypothetical protein